MNDLFASHRAHAATWTPGVVRGGRMTKWKGEAASYAPQLGTIIARAAFALGTALASGLILPGAAMAGTCAGGPTAWTCSGAASAGDTMQVVASAGSATVTTQSGFGITTAASDAINIVSAGSLTFTDANGATITGADGGIVARTNAAGLLTITSTGTATGIANDGIFASHSVLGTDLTVQANNTSGGRIGIIAGNNGTGALSVTSTGSARGTALYGISAVNSGTDLIVKANSTWGGKTGINARNYGTGALSVTSTGTATGTAEDGIYAKNSAAGTDLTIAANDTSGGLSGINATNLGTGALSVTSSGTATGAAYVGIWANNSAAGTDLTVAANNASGGQYGIVAINRGKGALSVTSSGTAAGMAYDGIFAYNFAAGTSLGVAAHDTSGEKYGIRARNLGTGALTVSSTGTATGTVLDGIYANNSRDGTDLTIVANNTSGHLNGIRARNYGKGSLSVTSTGTATGMIGEGIFGYNFAAGTSLSVAAHDTSGEKYGIRARNLGTGALTVTSSGAAAGISKDGIFAFNSAAGTSLSVTANNASGGVNGINAVNYGTDGLTIKVTGNVTGTTGDGIKTFNSQNDLSHSTYISQAAGTTTYGAINGIHSVNNAGSLTIKALGTSTGGSEAGISATNNAGMAPNPGTSLTITSDVASGGKHGIYARNNGTGALSVTSTGSAQGDANHGILAVQSSAGQGGLSVAANNTSGGQLGIYAANAGSGALTVSSMSAAEGKNNQGIRAINLASGTNLTVAALDTSGGQSGIVAGNLGTGALSVTSTGTATGTANTGIWAVNYAAGTSLSVTANNAKGGRDGILTQAYGSGGATVNVSGTVEGGSGWAINTFTQAGKTTTINLASTAVVGSAPPVAVMAFDGEGGPALGDGPVVAPVSGQAIQNNEGDSVLNVADGAVVIGKVQLGDGSDIANFSGAHALDQVTLLDGGDDATDADGWMDTLNLTGVTGTIDGGKLVNWEAVNVAGGPVTINGLNTATASACAGSLTLGGASAIGAGGVKGCATDDGITLTGDTAVAGALEGAGGADTIAVLGNASVLGGVYGGGNGADASAAADGGDTITIDTSGTVSLVDGQLGDDTIDLVKGRITGAVAGGAGDDTITLSGANVAGAITGDGGNDHVILSGGSAAGGVQGNDGDDVIDWNSAAATAPSIAGGSGSDTVNINDAKINLANVTLDGGNGGGEGGGTDTLNLNNAWSGSLKGAQTVNWEMINVNGGTVRFSDAAITAGTIAVKAGGTLDGSNQLVATANLAVSQGSSLVAGTSGGTNAMQVTGHLANAGMVTLQGGAAGDKLSVGGSYTGGGTLLVDSAIGSGKSDMLTIAGTASGAPTNVGVKVLDQGILAGGFMPVVTVAGGTPADGAFTSSSLPSTGLVLEKFVQNPANAHQFGIQQSFNPGSVQLASLSTLAGSVSALLDEPVGPYVTDRQGKERQVSLWMRNGGGSFDQNLTGSVGATGLAASFTDRTRMNYTTAQFGLDYGMLGFAGGSFNLHFGLTGGVYGARAHSMSGSTKIDGSFVGGYASLNGRHFTLDAALRHEWRDYTMINASLFAAGSARTKGTATSGSIAGSYSLDLGSRLKLVPSASYAWGASKVDAFVVDSLSTMTPGKDHQGLGRFGARLALGEANAYWAGEARHWSVTPYVGAYAVHNFSPSETGSASFGSSTLTLRSDAFKDAMQYSAGIGGHDATGKINLFLQGNLYRGGGVKAASVSGGLRFNF